MKHSSVTMQNTTERIVEVILRSRDLTARFDVSFQNLTSSKLEEEIRRAFMVDSVKGLSSLCYQVSSTIKRLNPELPKTCFNEVVHALDSQSENWNIERKWLKNLPITAIPKTKLLKL